MVWGLLTLSMSLAGALLTSRLINTPLTRLAKAINELASGHRPSPLQEDVPGEIAAVNRQFNRLSSELSALEADRALALAGISHDIRTPLARLRLEIEMSPGGAETKQSMIDDIGAIDRVIDQFIEFARGSSDQPAEPVDVSAFLDALRQRYRSEIESGAMQLDLTGVRAATRWIGRFSDLERIVTNLVENARRYGCDKLDGKLKVEISAHSDARGCELSVGDYGEGIRAEEAERLRRPFARGEAARSQPTGAGLGLAIVARLAERYGGELRLAPRRSDRPQPGGLIATVRLRHDSAGQ
jgi:two-component system osmolarity sensor histidine kinase EnvZ